jgi:hypothetical protein
MCGNIVDGEIGERVDQGMLDIAEGHSVPAVDCAQPIVVV